MPMASERKRMNCTILRLVFLEGTDFVTSGNHQVEQGNDYFLKFRSTSSVKGGRGECLPDDHFVNVGRNEEGNTGSETVFILKQLIKC